MKLDAVCQSLSRLAPLSLAEDWDNVGLLVGDRRQEVTKLMTCLTISPDVVDEAISKKADLIVSHHPLPFQPLKKITNDSVTGQMLLRLVRHGIAVYSAHTAFDSAALGINDRWANAFGIQNAASLINPKTSAVTRERASVGQTDVDLENSADLEFGSGRHGPLPREMELRDVAQMAKSVCGASLVRAVGPPEKRIKKLAFACGSGGSFLSAANRLGCDALLSGEATFHTCLEARSLGIGLILVGHYASERFAMESLAKTVADLHADVECWPSEVESDPLWH